MSVSLAKENPIDTIPSVTQQHVNDDEAATTHKSSMTTDNSTDNADTLSTDLPLHNSSSNTEDWQMVSSIEKPGSHTTTAATPPDADNRPTHSPTPSTTSYYDLLLSKFSRSGHHNSSKQVQLQEETSHNLEQLKEQSSRGDTDWEFWSSVISDFERVNRTEHSKFRSLISIGIPPQLRGKLWRIFSNSETDSDLVENEYRELLDQTSPHEKLIRRDLPRTFPTLPYFKDKDGEGQEMLFNVIKAYSLFDEHVGYCQGLHFVVGVLLLHMPDEAAFCVLLKLMGHYGLRGHFTPQMEKLHEHMYQFDQLLLQHLPQVHRHLDAQGVVPTMYASQWFMTLFAYRCPLELVYRVFDLLFVEGSNIILNFALALMKKNQQVILSLEFESLLEFFSGSIFDAYKDDAYDFVQDAYSFDIPSRQLAKLSKQYQAEAAKEAKMQSIEDSIRRENIELQEQIKKLKLSYKTLEKEHQDIAQQVISSKMSMASLDAENQQLKHELAVMKAEMVKIKNCMDDERQRQFDELAQHNAHLVDTNSQLEDRLSELEAVLIDMKLKYAESENDYELMKQKLHEAQKLSSMHH
ncbi:rab-GTPase-TBC domain-containing protein [Mucor lusitanicus]|uniref:Rab-GTPase-TBC domain-containing protein n=1 Tax=Mucor circinelloides f. lusitanicus TaxID=29924 RepID=A0A8H4BST0_MUCCL|nr:rab-GTPase-TBC domain-containing protein [Mucor lusitanicus]